MWDAKQGRKENSRDVRNTITSSRKEARRRSRRQDRGSIAWRAAPRCAVQRRRTSYGSRAQRIVVRAWLCRPQTEEERGAAKGVTGPSERHGRRGQGHEEGRNRRNRKEYERHETLACSSAEEIVLQAGWSLGSLSGAPVLGVSQPWNYRWMNRGCAELGYAAAPRADCTGATVVRWRQVSWICPVVMGCPGTVVRHGYWVPIGASNRSRNYQLPGTLRIPPARPRRPSRARQLNSPPSGTKTGYGPAP